MLGGGAEDVGIFVLGREKFVGDDRQFDLEKEPGEHHKSPSGPEGRMVVQTSSYNTSRYSSWRRLPVATFVLLLVSSDKRKAEKAKGRPSSA